MHEKMWKYIAVTSVLCFLFIVTTGAFWLYGTQKFARNINKSGENIVIAREKTSDSTYTEKHENPRLTFLAVGDVMLDRTMFLLAQRYNDFGYSFRMISSTLQQVDLRIANLEGPITTNKSTANIVNGGRGLSFTFSPRVTSTLKENFDILSLANNHTTNFGFEGLEQTKVFLDEAGIQWFGDPNNREDQKLGEIVEKNGIKIGFVGYHQLIEQGFEHVIAEIRRMRSEVDLLIAYPHWGHEYITATSTALQKKEAHEMIDAGVDIIIGAHPHVIQPIEVYANKLIFYSLGNFVFDQYFSLETSQGIVLRGDIEKTEQSLDINIELIPIHINQQTQPFIADTTERKQILSSLSTVSVVNENFKKEIENGMVRFTIFKEMK